MKIAKAVLLTLVLSMSIPIYAGAAELPLGIDFSIRFFDRRIYHVESDPIYIHLTITNNGPSTYRFKLADERVFSLDFDVRTASNRSLEAADSLIRKRTQYQQIFFREIAVEPGESFSFVEDLRTYINVNQPGSMVITARMYPELFRPEVTRTAAINGSQVLPRTVITLESKRLGLTVRPAAITGPDGIPLEMDIVTGAQLVRERLAPDQVVEYTLTARQKSQCERFFLYLDLETMLQAQNAANQRKWLNESEEGRRRMLDQFRQELQNPITDGSISVIPTSFEIERTQYNSFEGSVSVLQKYRNNNFTEIKRYTYLLRQRDNIWTIAEYSVINLGTE
jgi:hypothetical protein